jgi:signal transduction histidine kinase
MPVVRPRWRSIEWSLPVLISALLLVVVAVFGAVVSREVRAMALEAALERAGSVSQQLAGLFTGAVSRTRLDTREMAANPAIGRYLVRRDAASRSAAARVLETRRSAVAQLVGIEIRNADGNPVLRTGQIPTALAQMSNVRDAAGRAAREAWIGPIGAQHDTLLASITAPIVDANLHPIGYVVEYRRMVLQGAPTIRKLIGSDAVFLLGNRDGTLWTDLERVVPGPARLPPPPREGEPPTTVIREGWVGALATVATTPWVVWVAHPERSVTEPVRAALRRIAPIALLILVLGTAAGWIVSRRITGPLRDVTRAAAGIAAGDYTQRVRTDRRDELGRLAASFNAMAAQVEEGRHQLEARVAERTRELSTALEQLRETQAELVRKEKLALLGQLAGSVGHELRNPLGVMTNAVHYLGLVLGDAPPTVTEYLGILRRQIGLAERIVSDLLDSARVKPPQREPIAAQRVVAEQLERLGPLETIEVQVDVPADLPHLLVDRVQIGQVLFNVMTNAVQAMGGGPGTLAIVARADGAGMVRLDIRDTGTGIPPEHLEKIFEPLFTTKARGIGLGLSVARSLVAVNGGTLTVTSEVGRGSTFTVSLPTLARGGA